MKNKDKKFIAKTLTAITQNMLSVAANSRCMLIYHQPKQPKELKKFRKF
ncbi:MAG: cyclic lactone autoinducer peptide [Lachnospiraceae bacterium]|nr:cyclic lactone autoinducer peptide [Lachnospiraceae bacterium]